MMTVTTPPAPGAVNSSDEPVERAGRMIEIAVRVRANRLAIAEQDWTGTARGSHDGLEHASTCEALALADDLLAADAHLRLTARDASSPLVDGGRFVVASARDLRDTAIATVRLNRLTAFTRSSAQLTAAVHNLAGGLAGTPFAERIVALCERWTRADDHIDRVCAAFERAPGLTHSDGVSRADAHGLLVATHVRGRNSPLDRMRPGERPARVATVGAAGYVGYGLIEAPDGREFPLDVTAACGPEEHWWNDDAGDDATVVRLGGRDAGWVTVDEELFVETADLRDDRMERAADCDRRGPGRAVVDSRVADALAPDDVVHVVYERNVDGRLRARVTSFHVVESGDRRDRAVVSFFRTLGEDGHRRAHIVRCTPARSTTPTP